jgi:methenyltetrahydromethanopterin cyclohydrolase
VLLEQLMTLQLNERARRLADHLASQAAQYRVEVSSTPNGARLLDCGVKAQGGLQAGLALARVCLAGLADVSLVAGELGGMAMPLVQVSTDWPVAACMASQYAGWQLSVGKFFAMGSGPMRAAAGREELFTKIGYQEEAQTVVGSLETRKLPGDEVITVISEKTHVAPPKVTLLVAPASSQAGTLQVVARSVETALHKLFELGFDLSQLVAGFGAAPLPPVGKDELQAIGWTNDAILYGGRVTLWVRSDDALLAEMGPKVPSSGSRDHGTPFASVFERYNRDFYQIDPLLFSPAEVSFCNLNTGRMHRFGRIEPEILRKSFSG